MRLVFCLEFLGSSSLYKPAYYYGKGLGGGECALHLLTRQLAKMGHRVEIYNMVADHQCHDGVWHLPLTELDPTRYCDAFILFRSPNNVIRGDINTPVRLFWSIDQQTQGNYATDIFPFMDYTVTISPYHTRYHIARYGADPLKMNHIDLGVGLEDYQQDIEKVPGRLLYSSVSGRGLWHLPRLYQHIKMARPEASLMVTADYTLWGRPTDPTGLEEAPLHFGPLKDVAILGAVPRRDLVRYQLQADILAYPCIYEELFCLSIAEAQVAGAVPVTTDIGAIPTTLDTGYAIPLRPGMPQYEKAFVDRVVGLLSDRAELTRLQQEARRKASKRFDYDRIGSEWIALIKKLQKGEAIEMAQYYCAHTDGDKRCRRKVKASQRFCWQHPLSKAAERDKVLSPTDVRRRIAREGPVIHLGCRGHQNPLEIQVGSMHNVECRLSYDLGEKRDLSDATIVLLDVLPLWSLEDAKRRLDAFSEMGAEVVAFLPLNLQHPQQFGQVKSWSREELEDLGFKIEVLGAFHALPQGLVDAAWAIK